jgi:D-alanyl-D-alanine carboxypeptidase
LPAPEPSRAKPQQVAIATPAANSPLPRQSQFLAAVPAVRPVLKPAAGQGEMQQLDGPTWSIQVGAYADQALARAQLDNFSAKAKDILGAAAHIVAPIQSRNGHMIYRARFGPYAEREAREVCGQLTQRGQSCFVVTR